ncbi:MAG: hypothetical protein P4L99_04855 [Chthoniobacter sp.]|nr:hypothetical protein [Chthoniobacter sp.]
MKTLFGGWLALALLGMGVYDAAAVDKIVISSQKKPVSTTKVSAGGDGKKGADKTAAVFEFKLQNQTLADLTQLTVNYILFVERQKLGARLDQPSPVDRITGTQNIDVLSNRAPQSITTSEITLNKQTMGGGWTYNNGGRLRAEDSVVGVWVRVLQGGEVIAEYANPPTVTKRGWDAAK